MAFPLTVTFSIGCASGEVAPTSIPSSHGRLIPNPAQCRRNSSTLFSVGIRVSLKSSGILSWYEKSQVRLAANLLQQHQSQFAQMITSPHRALSIRYFLPLRDIIPSV